MSCRWGVGVLGGVLAVGLACASAGARPLAVIRDRGVLSLCAHANALPFASKTQDPPGFQIELGRALARELGVELECFQSNHEGALIDFLHEHIDDAQGALVNPAGLTQHGVPLHDAIKAMPFPVIEVHMSNIAAREPWRAHSIISPAVKGTIQGLGWRSYTAGLRALAEMAREKSGG